MARTAIGRRIRKRKLKAEINVVPYIDVMLVLLIIFMVTAPLLNLGVDIDLPQSNAKPIEQKKDPIVVSVDADGNYFLTVQGGQHEAIDAAGAGGQGRRVRRATTRTCRCSSPATASANYETVLRRDGAAADAPACRRSA